MSRVPGGRIAWSLVAVLAILHYDFWYWTDATLVMGFMPVGLFYHALVSLVAGVLWALVVKQAWPDWVEEWAEGDDTAGGEAS